MFILLGTDTRSGRRPIVTEALIILTMAAYLLVLAIGAFDADAARTLVDACALSNGNFEIWQLLTYQFAHDNPFAGEGGHAIWRLAHLGFNMMGLWVFGAALEDRMRPAAFLVFYLMGGVVAGLAHMGASEAPVIGASGSVCALVTGFFVVFPRSRVRVLVIFILITIWMAPAVFIVSLWIALDLLGWVGLGDSGTAYAAHLGGYVWGAGTCLALLPTPVIRRDGSDALSLMRQRQRRAQFARTVTHVPTGRTVAAAPKGFTEALTSRIRRGDLAGAARRFSDESDDHPDAVLSEPDQLLLANHLQATGDRAAAAEAYRRYLAHYAQTNEADEVRVLLALLLIRFLDRADEARPLLEKAREAVTSRRALVDQLLSEATP